MPPPKSEPRQDEIKRCICTLEQPCVTHSFFLAPAPISEQPLPYCTYSIRATIRESGSFSPHTGRTSNVRTMDSAYVFPPYASALDFSARDVPSLKITISFIIIRLESALSSDSSSNCGKNARNPFNARIWQRKERQTDQRPMMVRPGSHNSVPYSPHPIPPLT